MTSPTNRRRRRVLLSAGASAVAAGAAMLLRPDSVVIAHPHGEPLRLSLADLPAGQLRTIAWRGMPVWVLRRSASEIAALAAHEARLSDPQSLQSLQPEACRNPHRSLREDILVAVGLCTHQGCAPGLVGAAGFLCPCHSARYDLAGRVFQGGPAPRNLVIPAYHFVDSDTLLLGVDA